MMHDFLTDHRDELIGRCRFKVAQRPAPLVTPAELEFGIPLFLDQLVRTLEAEAAPDVARSRAVSGASGGAKPATSEIGAAASRHGRELLRQGFTVDQVVHDYGDLCQAITDLAFEENMPFRVDEFRTLNRCLDNAIADAVTEFNYQRDSALADRQTDALNVRLGFFAHELRNLLNTATLALAAVKAGNVGLTGATGGVLDRSLVGLRALVDRTLTEVRMAAGTPVYHRLFPISEFIAEIQLSASLEARVQGSILIVAPVDPTLAVDADRDLLLSAVGNLLQNAFKFTRPGTEVTLSTYGAADRILVEVADSCGGLPPIDHETLFRPFTQGKDKRGLGLGLSIARASVEANGGALRVRDVPRHGCVFTIDLARHSVRQPPVPA
jgi:signal transduction histidine kinase